MTDVSDRPWSHISPADYASETEYCNACLIDENEQGVTHQKAMCKLPVYEPQQLGGLLNRNAVRAAAARLVNRHDLRDVPLVIKRSVAAELVHLYTVIGEEPPASLSHLARAPALGGRVVRHRELDGLA